MNQTIKTLMTIFLGLIIGIKLSKECLLTPNIINI